MTEINKGKTETIYYISVWKQLNTQYIPIVHMVHDGLWFDTNQFTHSITIEPIGYNIRAAKYQQQLQQMTS